MTTLQCLPYLGYSEFLKMLLPAIIATAGVFITGMIAYRQYLVQRAKLNLDLFEQRYAIFEVTWGLLSSTPNGEHRPSLTFELSNLIPKAVFLFGPKIEAYMRTASHNMSELKIIYQLIHNNNQIVPPEKLERLAELEQWFYVEASVGVKSVFGEYLDFKNWK